ncbi:hypothetical protein VTO73DRAFT_12707 [Trametes versicolor]
MATSPPAKNTSLLTLPPELLSEVLQNTTAQALCRCRETCQILHRLIRETPSLRYKLELAAADLVDTPPPSGHALALEDRIQRIRRYRQAWDKLHLSKPRRFIIRAGAFHDTPQNWLFHPSGVLVERTVSEDLLCTRLVTPLGARSEEQWTIPLNNAVGHLKRFAIDPSQDLLVTLTSVLGGTRLAFRSLVSGKPHALAPRKVIAMHEPYRNTSFIRIQDSIVMVHGCSSTGDLLWNWKTGILVYTVKTYGRNQAALLDAGHVITVARSAIHAHSFDGDRSSPFNEDDTAHATYVSLMEPSGTEDGRIRVVFIGGQATVPHTSFCRLDTERTFCVFACHGREQGQPVGPPKQLHVSVPRSAILDCVSRMTDDDPRPSFGWDEWGAQGQSVQSVSSFFDWPQYSICGSRVLVARPTGDANAIGLEVLEYTAVSVSDPGSPEDKDGSTTSLRLNRRVSRSVQCPEQRLRRVYLWENGVVIQGDEAVHIISLEEQ